MTLHLSQSYDYCSDLTRRTAHNFRYSFLTLPPDQRRAMDVLYAFSRITDDLGDEISVPLELRRARLTHWRESIRSAIRGCDETSIDKEFGNCDGTDFLSHPARPAIADIVDRYQIPQEYLFAVIDGVEMDLESVEMLTFADLERYCYHVAGAVGLCCIHIWGFRGEDAIPFATDCGLAFQLTNILRDVAEDASAERVYLPREDLERFSYSAEDLQAHVVDDRFFELMRFETDRAKSYYTRAERLFDFLEPQGKRILRTMIDIYGALLREIERRNFDIFSKRVSIPKWKKLWFAGRAMLLTR